MNGVTDQVLSETVCIISAVESEVVSWRRTCVSRLFPTRDQMIISSSSSPPHPPSHRRLVSLQESQERINTDDDEKQWKEQRL